MQNPLVELVEHELGQHGLGNAKLVRASYNAQNFGNAEAIYELGNLRLRFVRDRSQDMVSIGSPSSPQHVFSFDDVAVLMGWISPDELLDYDGAPINFDMPPPGPLFSLKNAVDLIAGHLTQLDNAFSSNERLRTHAKLKDVERRRVSSAS